VQAGIRVKLAGAEPSAIRDFHRHVQRLQRRAGWCNHMVVVIDAQRGYQNCLLARSVSEQAILSCHLSLARLLQRTAALNDVAAS